MFDEIIRLYQRGIYSVNDAYTIIKCKLSEMYTSGHIYTEEYLAYCELADRWRDNPIGMS